MENFGLAGYRVRGNGLKIDFDVIFIDCECRITAIMIPSQGIDGGPTPLTRSEVRRFSLVVKQRFRKP